MYTISEAELVFLIAMVYQLREGYSRRGKKSSAVSLYMDISQMAELVEAKFCTVVDLGRFQYFSYSAGE